MITDTNRPHFGKLHFDIFACFYFEFFLLHGIHGSL